MPLRNETVRRRSCFGFDNGIGFTPPLLFALVLLLLLCFPVDHKQIKHYSVATNLVNLICISHLMKKVSLISFKFKLKYRGKMKAEYFVRELQFLKLPTTFLG